MTFDSVGPDEGFFTNSAWWAVSAPIRIQINALKAKGNAWSDKSTNAEWSDIKIAGSNVVAIRSRADGGTYEVDVQKTGGDVGRAIVVPRSSSGPIQILFDQPADNKPIGTSLSVLDEASHVLTTVDLTALPEVSLPDGLFPDGKLYFGTDTMNNSSLVVTGLSIGSQPSGKWVEQGNVNDYLNSPGLSKVAERRDVSIGTEFMVPYAIDRRYCQAMLHDFNLADTSDFTWKWFWPKQGEYAWGLVDREVDFALQHGLRVRAYLGWGSPESLPDWLINSNYSRDEYVTILKEYMTSVIGHFKGRIQEWVIANESIERIACETPEFYDVWYRRIGPDYIKLEFQTAREADPAATLILNSSNNHAHQGDCMNRTINNMRDTVIAFNSGGTKMVDAIGMEMHLHLPLGAQVPPSKEDVLKIMQDFSKLGVRIYITEMDVDINFMQGKYPTQDERWAFQAGIYRNMAQACLESGACGSFATQGIGDSMSWYVESCQGCYNEPNAAPLMFDANFLPKPAYFAVRDALMGQ